MQHRRIIKQGPVVLATHEDGSMAPDARSSQGLFLGDTRFLSRFQLLIAGQAPLLLGSTEEILFQSSFLHTNPDLPNIPARGIGILQKNSIEEGSVQFEIAIANWSLEHRDFEISIELSSDFFDTFEARGVKRMERGEIKPAQITPDSIALQYVGLDHVTRCTNISVAPPMTRCDGNCIYFQLSLADGATETIQLNLKLAEQAPEGVSLEPKPDIARVPKPSWFDDSARISVNDARVRFILERCTDDLEVLLTEWRGLWVPAAGLPRFTVPFGRDCLISGLMTLMWNPALARDVLRFLAKTQGKEVNPWNYEQPGKIMHEMHTGELARLKEVPFGLFYGSVDSTPLFLVLAGEYIRWTGDLQIYRELKDNFDRAWKWIDEYSHFTDDVYIQYKAHTPPKASSAALTVGLYNQGWKDSSVAVMYADGTMARQPIALAEVQGQLYRALHLWGELYEKMPESEGMRERAADLRSRARCLKERFNREFWMEEKKYFAMALDGDGKHVDSITSNPAHCLWARLVDEDLAIPFVQTLMDKPMMTEWGIRTMANTEKAFNPFSYHDGSIWPFENALIASGLKKYGCVAETQRVLGAMVDASLYFEYRRWPEVYCGVSKEVGGVLAQQPDASRPQAWSASAIFLLMQTVLGMSTRPFEKHVDITPALPAGLDEITVDNIAVAGGKLGLRLLRENSSVLMEVRDNPDELDIVVHPATGHRHGLYGEHAPAISR